MMMTVQTTESSHDQIAATPRPAAFAGSRDRASHRRRCNRSLRTPEQLRRIEELRVEVGWTVAGLAAFVGERRFSDGRPMQRVVTARDAGELIGLLKDVRELVRDAQETEASRLKLGMTIAELDAYLEARGQSAFVRDRLSRIAAADGGEVARLLCCSVPRRGPRLIRDGETVSAAASEIEERVMRRLAGNADDTDDSAGGGGGDSCTHFGDEGRGGGGSAA